MQGFKIILQCGIISDLAKPYQPHLPDGSFFAVSRCVFGVKSICLRIYAA